MHPPHVFTEVHSIVILTSLVPRTDEEKKEESKEVQEQAILLRAPIHLHPKEAYSFTGFVKTEKKELFPSMMNFLTSPWHRHTEALVFVKAFPLKLSLLLDFTDLSDIPYKDLHVELLLFLHSPRTLALPLVFRLVQPLFICLLFFGLDFQDQGLS
jgi:hypothetical protein